MRVYSQLPSAPVCKWKRILSAKRPGLNHVYCVFKLGDQLYAYDPVWGSRRIEAPSLDASALATAIDPGATHGQYLYPRGSAETAKLSRKNDRTASD